MTGDAVVGTVDASQILQYKAFLIDSFSGYPSLVRPTTPLAADVSGDGIGGTVDASLILQQKAFIISHFPADTNMDGAGPDCAAPGSRSISGARSVRVMSLEDQTDAIGNTVTVPLRIGDADGVMGYFVWLSYPPDLLAYVGLTGGDLSVDWPNPIVNDGVPGEIIIVAAGAGELSGTGTLLDLSFEVIGAGSGLVSVAELELNDRQIAVDGRDAEIWTFSDDDDNWVLQIDLGAADDRIAIGMQSEATDGIDINHDKIASYALTEELGVYLLADETSLQRDIRSVADEAEWLLAIREQHHLTRLSWPVPDLPGGKYLSMHEVDGEAHAVAGVSLRLHRDNELALADGFDRYFVVRYTGTMRLSLSMSTGWNLISLPFSPEPNIAAAIFLDSNGLSTLSRVAWGWENGGYEVVEVLKGLRGYWIFAEAAATVTVNGVPVRSEQDQRIVMDAPGSFQMRLDRGTNLIGPVDTVPLQTEPANAVKPAIWTWTDGQYERHNGLQTLRGHWIEADGDDVLIRVSK